MKSKLKHIAHVVFSWTARHRALALTACLLLGLWCFIYVVLGKGPAGVRAVVALGGIGWFYAAQHCNQLGDRSKDC